MLCYPGPQPNPEMNPVYPNLETSRDPQTDQNVLALLVE